MGKLGGTKISKTFKRKLLYLTEIFRGTAKYEKGVKDGQASPMGITHQYLLVITNKCAYFYDDYFYKNKGKPKAKGL